MKIEVLVDTDDGTGIVKIDGKHIDDIVTYFKVWMPHDGNIKYKCGIDQKEKLIRKTRRFINHIIYRIKRKLNIIRENIKVLIDKQIDSLKRFIRQKLKIRRDKKAWR